MARPSRLRRICCEPEYGCFSPDGITAKANVILGVDEYEAIRLIDLEKKTQEQCAEQMDISRTTVTEIYESARKKIAESLVYGKPLLIGGGHYRLCDGTALCPCSKRCKKTEKKSDEALSVKGNETMRIAVTYENGNIFQHFGHTEHFKIFDVSDGKITNESILDTNGNGHGALAGILSKADVDVLICGGIGGGAQTALKEAGIRLFGGAAGKADDAVNAFLAGKLVFNPNVMCSHHSHEHSCGENKNGCKSNVPEKKKISPDEIKRVKGLGCLQDKRFDDIFNVRVITKNGKLTSKEQIAIAQASEKFGSGEVTMTARLTLEIQGVPYDKLEELFAFLKENNLETGGTGAKVRPVVSCKGTTCQYGLIDTFALSQRIHEIFYEGYHDVALPHKFKIAVGGCPNNCVKPELNDIGVIGQRVVKIDEEKCRGCKACQIEKNCPIGVAKMVDEKIVIDPESCNHCGRCIGKCPFGAVNESMTGYKVYIGGRWGKKVAQGKPLGYIFESEDKVIEVIERAILLFKNEGIAGERFSDTIARLGFDYVEKKLVG